jgi:hypothetical protein
MHDVPDPAPGARPRRDQEYEDPHFHDEDAELPPADEENASGRHVPARRKVRRKPPSRRYYEDG